MIRPAIYRIKKKQHFLKSTWFLPRDVAHYTRFLIDFYFILKRWFVFPLWLWNMNEERNKFKNVDCWWSVLPVCGWRNPLWVSSLLAEEQAAYVPTVLQKKKKKTRFLRESFHFKPTEKNERILSHQVESHFLSPLVERGGLQFWRWGRRSRSFPCSSLIGCQAETQLSLSSCPFDLLYESAQRLQNKKHHSGLQQRWKETVLCHV